ncbi:MAG: CIA30 family protein, partial [Cyanobium sp.]
MAGDGFVGWHALNDTIMGGRSSGSCSVSQAGLRFLGELIEQGGG